MASRAEVIAELTDWLCAWVDLDRGAVRLAADQFRRGHDAIDERHMAPYAGKVDTYAPNALRDMERRLGDLGLVFSAGDTILIRQQQNLAHPGIGPVLMNELRALVVDFRKFSVTPQFNAKQQLANTFRILRALSR